MTQLHERSDRRGADRVRCGTILIPRYNYQALTTL